MFKKPNSLLKTFLSDKKHSSDQPAAEAASQEVQETSTPQELSAPSGEETDAPKPKRERVFPYTSDALQILYNNWLIETDTDGVSEDIADHMSKTAYRMENHAEYNFDVNLKRFFMSARIAAKKRLNDHAAAVKKAASSEEQPEYSAPAEPIFYITPDSMMLLAAVLPPIGNGAHIQAEQLTGHIYSSGIQAGIAHPLIKKIVEEKSYFTIYPLAAGTPAVPGTDGRIISHVPQEEEVSYNETEFGNVDFASRNFLTQVSTDEVICEIIEPSDGTDGVDLFNHPIHAKAGKPPLIPQGKNTTLSEDRTQLLAAVDGYITYKNGTFRVVPVLEIQGNVDFSVGNVNFNGGIVIHGDVLNGFDIQADGDVVVHGVVEAARITSTGNIVIKNGMNGNFEGELNAKGDIRSPFLENALVSSGKDIYTGSLICCDVFCDGTIHADSGMGIVIGGSLTAMHSIKARIIGNKAGRKTELTLGTLPHAVKEKDGLEKDEKTVDETIEFLQKNISYLKGIEQLPDQKVQVLKQLEQQYQLYSSQKESLKRRQETILKQMNLVEEATIECKTIYPVTIITISGVSTKIKEVTHNAKISLNEAGALEISSHGR